jgi:hypothetical protein
MCNIKLTFNLTDPQYYFLVLFSQEGGGWRLLWKYFSSWVSIFVVLLKMTSSWILCLWKNRQLGRFCLSHNILIYLNIYIRLKIKPNSVRIRSLSWQILSYIIIKWIWCCGMTKMQKEFSRYKTKLCHLCWTFRLIYTDSNMKHKRI